MKLRDEFETVVGDGVLLLRIFEELGYQVWFRYEKYREEFAHEDVIVAIDETPVGVFVEIEGSEGGITAMAAAMGRGARRLHPRLVSRPVPEAPRRARARRHRHGVRRHRVDDARAGAGGGPGHPAASRSRWRARKRRRRSTASRSPAAPSAGWSATAFRDLVLNLHHKPESIAAVVGDGARPGCARALFVGIAGARFRRRPAPCAAAPARSAFAARRFRRDK